MKLFVELRVEDVDAIRKKSIDETVDGLTLLLHPDEGFKSISFKA